MVSATGEEEAKENEQDGCTPFHGKLLEKEKQKSDFYLSWPFNGFWVSAL